MIEYFERNGAPPCPKDGNPAEWMLKVTQPAPDSLDWHSIWLNSPEHDAMKAELRRLRDVASSRGTTPESGEPLPHSRKFMSPYSVQYKQVFIRTLKHFWRSPTYMYSKFGLMLIAVRVFASLIIPL